MKQLSKAKMPGKKMQDMQAADDAALLAEMPEGEEFPEMSPDAEAEPEMEAESEDMSAKFKDFSDEELQAELDRRQMAPTEKAPAGMPKFSPNYGS